MMLHLVSAPRLTAAICQRTSAGDDLVLQGGAVWAVLQGHADHSLLQSLIAANCGIHAMADLLVAAGIDQQRLVPGVRCLDYAGLVDLTVKHSIIHTWC